MVKILGLKSKALQTPRSSGSRSNTSAKLAISKRHKKRQKPARVTVESAEASVEPLPVPEIEEDDNRNTHHDHEHDQVEDVDMEVDDVDEGISGITDLTSNKPGALYHRDENLMKAMYGNSLTAVADIYKKLNDLTGLVRNVKSCLLGSIG